MDAETHFKEHSESMFDENGPGPISFGPVMEEAQGEPIRLS